MIVGLAGWILFAFAGLDAWTVLPLAAGVAVLAVRERPQLARVPDALIDGAVVACLGVVALQLVPLAPALRERVAPGAVVFDRALRFAGSAGADSGPASIEPGATRFSLILGSTIVLLFWSAKATFARGGLRTASRGIAWLGLALAALAIVTHSTSERMLYWVRRPYTSAAMPYGPFINRNDLAAWLLMAIPLVVGYMIARADSGHRSRSAHSVVDATGVWLGASVCLMVAALMATASRSGFTGIAAAAAFMFALSRRSLTRRRAAGLLIGSLVLIAVAATYVDWSLVFLKLDAVSDGIGRRQTVWRFSWTMAKDFWPAGVGLGAFQSAILLYPQPFPLFYINHAHSQYLQFLAEGGLFLALPAAAAVMLAAWVARQRLAADRTPAFWIRAGAVSGVVGLLVDSVSETTLRMPANAVLFAILCAIALHDGGAGSAGTLRRQTPDHA